MIGKSPKRGFLGLKGHIMRNIASVAGVVAVAAATFLSPAPATAENGEIGAAKCDPDRSGRSAWPELAPGLTPDSIKQKYPQTIVSTRIVPGCMQFLGEERRFYTVWARTGSGFTPEN